MSTEENVVDVQKGTYFHIAGWANALGVDWLTWLAHELLLLLLLLELLWTAHQSVSHSQWTGRGRPTLDKGHTSAGHLRLKKGRINQNLNRDYCNGKAIYDGALEGYKIDSDAWRWAGGGGFKSISCCNQSMFERIRDKNGYTKDEELAVLLHDRKGKVFGGRIKKTGHLRLKCFIERNSRPYCRSLDDGMGAIGVATV